MMAKLKPLNDTTGKLSVYVFYCPGCKNCHHYDLSRWQFNGNLELPSFTPSLRIIGPNNSTLCHLYVTNGKIQYCNDCPHNLSGQTVDMLDWKDGLWE